LIARQHSRPQLSDILMTQHGRLIGANPGL
jgi:hypothetical protein